MGFKNITKLAQDSFVYKQVLKGEKGLNYLDDITVENVRISPEKSLNERLGYETVGGAFGIYIIPDHSTNLDKDYVLDSKVIIDNQTYTIKSITKPNIENDYKYIKLVVF